MKQMDLENRFNSLIHHLKYLLCAMVGVPPHGPVWSMASKRKYTLSIKTCCVLYDSLDGRGVWGTMRACCHFSHIRLFVTPLTVAHQAPLSMGFSRQEYWSGLPCPSLGDLPDPGIESASLSPALAGGIFTTRASWEALGGEQIHVYVLLSPLAVHLKLS